MHTLTKAIGVEDRVSDIPSSPFCIVLVDTEPQKPGSLAPLYCPNFLSAPEVLSLCLEAFPATLWISEL